MKYDLKGLLDDFYAGKLDIQRLNYRVITLLPKSKDAAQIQKFDPVCLLNVSFKIITKVLMNRLNKQVDNVISSTQTTSKKKRYIMEGVLLLNETLNTIRKNK